VVKRVQYWLFLLMLQASVPSLAFANDTVNLSAEESAFLENLGQIKLCVAPNSPPLDYIKNGRHLGIGADYLKLIESRVPISFQLVKSISWQESLDKVKARSCDVISLIRKTPDRSTYLSFTDEFIEIPYVLITTQDKHFVSKFEKLADNKLGIKNGFGAIDILKQKFPDVNLHPVKSLKEGLEQVDEGELFGFLAGLYVGGHAIQSGSFNNLKINAHFDDISPVRLGIGVRRGLEPLVGVLNKIIATINIEDAANIEKDWLTVQYQVSENYQRTIQVVVVSIGIVLFFIYRHYHLRKLNVILKEREKQIWHQANFDYLTGLPNRRLFQDRLEQKLSGMDRQAEEFALLLIDLDGFKNVNDSLGHDQGDKLLVEAARRMKRCLRKSDIVARLGGDEFVIIISSIQHQNYVENVLEKILLTVRAPYELKEVAHISTSIGVALCPGDSANANQLMNYADQALYAAKAKGRDNFHYYTDTMQTKAIERLSLTKDLLIAMHEKQFELLFHPIINLKNYEVQKAEALPRWNHPKEGTIRPRQFIPLLEESRKIVEFGNWTFEQATDQLIHWRQYRQDFQVSINISSLQFQSKNNRAWFHLVKNNLNSLDSGGFIVEVTEKMLMQGRDNIKEQLFLLRELGFSVALDNFGTGYSSLPALKRSDIDYLKIDRSLVANIAIDPVDLAICEAIILMAHKLGLKIIAEGIEHERQEQLLIEAGCDFGQGYYYSKPVSADQFEKRFLNSKIKD